MLTHIPSIFPSELLLNLHSHFDGNNRQITGCWQKYRKNCHHHRRNAIQKNRHCTQMFDTRDSEWCWQWAEKQLVTKCTINTTSHLQYLTINGAYVLPTASIKHNKINAAFAAATVMRLSSRCNFRMAWPRIKSSHCFTLRMLRNNNLGRQDGTRLAIYYIHGRQTNDFVV